MPVGAPLELDFSNWDGTPFFQGQPENSRKVYVVRTGDDAFLAFGLVEPATRYLFKVRGSSKDELERFVDQVESEGAQVLYESPPLETKDSGEKPPPTNSTPSGYKGSKPGPR